MAERSKAGSGSANSDTNDFSIEAKIAEVMRIIETLDYRELKRLNELIGQEYKTKAEAATVRVIEEARERFEELGLTFEQVAEMQSKRKRTPRTPAKPKFMSPDGKLTWTGRGQPPKFIKEHEASGGNRNDFLIK
jgi:DNA-binding protein H-NS